MIISNKSHKLHLWIKYFPFSSGVSAPILPVVTSEIIRLTPSIKNSKRRLKKLYNGNANGPNGPSGTLPSGNSIIEPFSFKYAPEEFVNLFSIYGNILLREGEEFLFRYKEVLEDFSAYPLDPNLTNLFENSVRFWYETDGKESKKLPSILSINAPSRSSTWELTRHLVSKSGRSHLATIPFQMFYDLLQTCTKRNPIREVSNNVRVNESKESVKEAKALGDFILKNLTGDFRKTSKDQQNQFLSSNSRAVIQVVEYLFACLEATLGGAESQESERFTLFLDGVEEYFESKKGGDAILRDLTNWINLFESSGRIIVFGGRNQNLITEEALNEAEESESGQGDDHSGNPGSNISSSIISLGSNNNNTNKPNSSNTASPFQVITDLVLKAAGSKSQSDQSESSETNVKIEGPVMRLYVNGPKNDKRKLLKYSQLLGTDRKKDIFDLNMSLLKSIASGRWNMNLKLNLKSKYDFPSNHPEIWDNLSESGRGVLMKKKLTRDEINEIVLYISGKGIGGKVLNVENLRDAMENVSQIRHDPTKFSSDDLNHLLAERQISMNSLTKYEKRFINCISTSTTQTLFSDISLPNETVNTLKSLTSLPLTHPELFTHGVLKNSLTGVLLFGPPGTGKTMLARAVAQESGAAFLAVNMSNIFDMWVGEGEKNVKGLFNLARKLSPSIIFIDEIDALLERRSSISGRSSRLEIVNEFMSQWDGLSSNLNSGVVVMGATNRPFVLDDAVLRRLPRRLLIDLPDAQNRHKILINLLKENLCENELLDALPEMTAKMDFYSGSDLKNVAITAALKSAMRLASSNSPQMIITKKDFDEAVREVPASLSDQMDSLAELRKWNQMYGESKGESHRIQKKFGFA